MTARSALYTPPPKDKAPVALAAIRAGEGWGVALYPLFRRDPAAAHAEARRLIRGGFLNEPGSAAFDAKWRDNAWAAYKGTLRRLALMDGVEL